VRLVPPGVAPAEGGSAWRLQGVAIGDSCLFLVRGGALLRKFPLQTSAELESDPVVLGSVDLNRDDVLRFHRFDEPCQSGDLVVLCTDAIAGWALRLEEAGTPPAWETYWDLDATVWREQILAMRAERDIRCDDTTLALLRIVDQKPVAVDGDPAEGVTVETARDSSAADVEPHEPPVPDVATVPPPVSPEGDWVRKVLTLSGRATEGLAQGVARGVERLKKAGQAAQSKVKDYLDQLREDDR